MSIELSMPRLFRSGTSNSREFTTTAYAVNFYPDHLLGKKDERLIRWQSRKILTKAQILQHANTELTKLYYQHDPDPFQIHWEFNAIPTEQEWSNWWHMQKFRAMFRISPAAYGNGRIVVLQQLK